MPKAIRKSVSRCSSRSSCRKRNSPRDNVLNTIRETIRSSSNAGQYAGLKSETPPLQKPKAQPETKLKKSDTEVKVSETSDNNPVAEKPRSLIQHGIRYILLPLHLLHLCVWGSPSSASSETNKTESSTVNLQETKKSSRKTLTPSPTCSTSGFSFCSSNVSKTRKIPSNLKPSSSNIAEIVASTSSTSSVKPVEKLSPKIHRAPIPRRIFNEETIDYSSDEMVTADEYYDDSSNDRWSSAQSSPCMNMSIDFESFNVLEKIPPISSEENCSLEEPMDVSMEESSFNLKQSICNKSPLRKFHTNSLKSNYERKSDISSSSGSEELSRPLEDFSSSSADREIAGIFRRASASSSSSDDEDYNVRNGRRNNNFIGKPSDIELLRSRLQEESCNSTIRKKTTSFASHDSFDFQAKIITREDPGNTEHSSRMREKPNQRLKNVENVSNQTDSAYSDEDVEMNVINESMNNRLQEFPMQSLQESVIEWMDQDLDYVADTEDSNDGSALPVKSKMLPGVINPSSGSVQQDNLQICLNPASLQTEENFKSWDNRISGEEILTNVQTASKEVEKNVERTKKTLETVSSPEVQNNLDHWRKNFGFDRVNFDGQITRGPPGFPEKPQNPPGTKCHCGNPQCFFLPLALPVNDSSSASWSKNYPPAPSPLRHLYYEYPEFMIPSRERTGEQKPPYVLVPANLVLS